MATLRQACYTALRNYSPLTSLLPEGASSIISAGMMKAGKAMPCVTIQMGPAGGGIRGQPNYTELVFVRVYYSQLAMGSPSFKDIDAIVEKVRAALDNTGITTDDDFTWKLQWDSFTSGDLFDEVYRANFRTVRFRAFRLKT